MELYNQKSNAFIFTINLFIQRVMMKTVGPVCNSNHDSVFVSLLRQLECNNNCFVILFYDQSIIIHLVYLIYDVSLELMYTIQKYTIDREILSNVCYRLVTQIQLLQANVYSVKLNQIFRHLLSFTFEKRNKQQQPIMDKIFCSFSF